MKAIDLELDRARIINYTLYNNVDYRLTMNVKDNAGNDFDFTNHEVKIEGKLDKKDTEAAIVFVEGDGLILSLGRITWDIRRSKTNNKINEYEYELSIRNTTTDTKKIAKRGRMKILKGIS